MSESSVDQRRFLHRWLVIAPDEREEMLKALMRPCRRRTDGFSLTEGKLGTYTGITIIENEPCLTTRTATDD